MKNTTLPTLTSFSKLFPRRTLTRIILGSFLLSLNWSYISHTGLDMGCNIAYKESVALFADRHDAGTIEQESAQTPQMADTLEQRMASRDGIMLVILEQTADLIGRTGPMGMLATTMKQRGWSNIRVKDKENRKAAASAYLMFQEMYPTLDEEDCFYEGSYSNEALAIQHLLDEYDRNLAEAKEFRRQYTGQLNFTTYDELIELAEENYAIFREFLVTHCIRETDKVLEIAKRAWFMGDKSKTYNAIGKGFEEVVGKAFGWLFDLHLFKIIHEHKGADITFIGGGGHVKSLKKMLLDQKADVVLSIERNTPVETDPEKLKILSKSDMHAIMTGFSAWLSFMRLLEKATIRILVCYVNLTSPSDPDKDPQ